jgi:hypothetical protein
MADDIDLSNDRVMLATDAGIAAVRREAANIPKGRAGECKACGEYTKRLVTGICAPCRDRALIGYAKGRK